MRTLTILLFLLFSLHFPLFSQKDVFVIKRDSSMDDMGVHLSTRNGKFADSLQPKWRFSSKDDPSFKNFNFNDSAWISCNSEVNIKSFKVFKGFGWFRAKIRLQTTEDFVPAILLLQNGASEIYLDGKLISKLGTVAHNKEKEVQKFLQFKPIYLPVRDTFVHVLAVRMSNQHYQTFYEDFDDPKAGFVMSFTDYRAETKNSERASLVMSSFLCGLSGILIALALVHFIMYAYDREQVFNLYQALFVLVYGILVLIPIPYMTIEDPFVAYKTITFSTLLLPLFFFFVTRLTHVLFENKGKIYMNTVMIVSLLCPLFMIFYRDLTSPAISILSVIVFFGSIIVSIKAIRKKKRGAKFVGTGILITASSVVALFVFLLLLSILPSGALSDVAVLVILLSLLVLFLLSTPFSLSFYLAKEFSTRSKKLKDQLLQIEDLSAQALRQEQEKKVILEKQNEVLEEQVKARTEEVMNQNRILEHQKKEITDSINYSRRIQKAILPEEEEMKRKLSESFVLYIPKDIVSGDFYFYHETAGGCIVAAVDCTGHGVPGAFMSLIGKENLDKAVSQSVHPGTILTLLNKGVKKSLRQNHQDATRDGMDAAICVIEDQSLRYSGANRPLWIIRKGSSEVEEIKATKCAIGGLTTDDQLFEEHSVDCKSGDRVYLFSDGYPDQFGGPLQKKLTSKKFRQWLLESMDLNCKEQGEFLKTKLEEWKGNTEQVDDVLVIGIGF